MKIGIDLGGSHVGVGLIEGDKLIIVENKYFTPEDLLDSKNAIVKNIDELIYKIITENDISMEKIEAIGAASPGTIASGKIRSWNLKLDWFDLQSILANKYNKRVRVRNDGKCAALAEKKYGILKDYDDAVFINIGTGIGGAAFINGNFLEPKRFSGFEFGHMTVQKDGIDCACGKKGCFERYGSIRSMKYRIRDRLNIDISDLSGQYMRETLMKEHWEELKGDIEDWVCYLATGIGNLIDIFEPEIVCFGGSFSYYEGHPVYEMLMEELKKPNRTFNKVLPIFKTAAFKNDAGIIGSTIDI